MGNFDRDVDKEAFWRLEISEPRDSGPNVRVFCAREGLDSLIDVERESPRHLHATQPRDVKNACADRLSEIWGPPLLSGYSLSPASIMPRTICFWKSRNTIRTGTVARVLAARVRLYSS